MNVSFIPSPSPPYSLRAEHDKFYSNLLECSCSKQIRDIQRPDLQVHIAGQFSETLRNSVPALDFLINEITVVISIAFKNCPATFSNRDKVNRKL